MSSLGVDVSNYTDPITADAARSWQSNGIELVIVQAVDPPAGFPAGQTRAQIETCQSVGLAVDAYVWLWFDLDTSDIQHKLSLLDGLNVRQIWLDVEDTASVKYDQATCEQKVTDALALCDGYPNTGGQKTGIYSGRWFWSSAKYLGNSTKFSDRKLWDANYDHYADSGAGFLPYGGWDHCEIKQYEGTTSLDGINGVDLNALSDDETASLHPAQPPSDVDPRDQRIADLTTALSDVTGQSGEIRTALAGAQKLSNVKSVRQSLQAIDARLGALNAQFLGN